MKMRILAGFMALVIAGPVAAADSPYAGLENRRIKALSPAQIDDLRAGRGMGFALAAELNNYPGPRHVLDLAKPLGLSKVQRAAVSELFTRMAAEAKQLGARIVEAEKRLDALFADKRAGKDTLRTMTMDIAELNGQLRFLHLGYHLDVRALLSDAQIVRYGRLRGYRGPGESGSTGGHHPRGGHK